jgi:hypothetical protein
MLRTYFAPAPYRPDKTDIPTYQTTRGPRETFVVPEKQFRQPNVRQETKPTVKQESMPQIHITMRDTNVDIPKHYNRVDKYNKPEAINSYKQYLAHDVSIIKAYLASTGLSTTYLKLLTNEEMAVITQIVKSKPLSKVVDTSMLLQLCAYSSQFPDIKNVFASAQNMQNYIAQNLDITQYEMIDTDTDDFNGSFIEHSLTNADEVKKMLLEQSYQLSNKTDKTGFVILVSTDRITDVFKWVGRDILADFISDKDPSLAPEKIQQMIKKIYKDAPDVQLSTMTDLLNQIANQNRELATNILQIQNTPTGVPAVEPPAVGDPAVVGPPVELAPAENNAIMDIALAKPVAENNDYVLITLYGKDFLRTTTFNRGDKRNLEELTLPDGTVKQSPNLAYLIDTKAGTVINWPDDITYTDLKKGYRVVKKIDLRPPPADTNIEFLNPRQSVPRDKTVLYIKYSQVQKAVENPDTQGEDVGEEVAAEENEEIGNGYKKKKVKGGKLENFFNLTSFEKIYTNQQNARFTYLLTF